jgi:hypothetical protein
MARQDLATVFNAFRDQCIWLMACRNTFRELFESGEETRCLLGRTAPMFFGDLNIVFREYVILQIWGVSEFLCTRRVD